MEALIYLLRFAFDAILTILIMRVWLQLVKADFYNPLSQFIVKVSNPLVVPLRRIIPGFGGIDIATILLAYLMATGKILALSVLSGGEINLTLFLYIGLLIFLKQVGFLLFIIMLVMALMSWVVQGYNPTQMIFQQLCEPVLGPIRRIVPSIGGLDLSVLIAFLLLNVINIFLSGAVPYWGML